jgi:hypothetical protein
MTAVACMNAYQALHDTIYNNRPVRKREAQE